ncbi:chorismate--pyruvate lyase family protein [Legionella bononiensis]|uniref:Chorismate lyase n=1 Tax=Legionella bononiensis TaxID=2793102 RepID=A0ABS1W7K9_9GAMM|nr:chorismate lyase [Legionella bononiensis]MBL7480139.1 chorismate lyase [Legionella bononiensis]MBL7525346.1 chorismate lyase [Legionella bononiensis]MBL7561530.1 chorismate lyase [Legionella bononiensis]
MYINSQPIYIADSQDSEFLKEWREYEDSLTDKLISSRGSADLELVFQNWIKTDWWSQYVLQIQDGHIFLREILMKNTGIEYWYARTIIPQRCYDSNPDFFNRLQNESIRNLIFGESRVQRVQMICYPVDSDCIEYHWVKNHVKTVKGILWVRLAEYSVQQTHRFYLIEILLPQLESVS